MKKKALLVGILVLVVIGAALGYYYWPFRQSDELRFSGIVEIQEVRLGSKIGGRVYRVLTIEGSQVEPGQSLVVFEAPELEVQKEQLQAQVAMADAEYQRAVNGARVEEKKAAKAAADAAKAKLDRLVEGWREEEKRQVASELENAQAEHKQAADELVRISDLYQRKSASRSEYDAAVAARDRARARLNAARARNEMYQAGSRKEDIAEARAEFDKAQARYEELYNGTRPEDIALAKAKLDQTRAKLREVEINLAEAVVKAPPYLGKATVEVLAVRPGDLVTANQPVVRVLRAEDLWVKVFVPETKLGHVKLDMPVEVRIDSFPNKKFQGVVRQIASASEFTPRNVQSVDERRHQVFAVKIFIDNPQGVFHAGMAAEVLLPLSN